MNTFFTIIKLDYLQRTRSYAFLITLCVSIAIGYTFVPEPNANYSTIQIAGYVGYYNSAWFGYVTAIMTSVFLALIGFYLVNSGIKRDSDTKVGHIVASTPITNFKYLSAKVISNFMVLLSIVAVVFLMSILLFVLYNDGYDFHFLQFIKPYAIITIPAILFVSVLALVFELCFGSYTLLQQITYFFLFSVLLVAPLNKNTQLYLDVFGTNIVISQLKSEVGEITKSNEEVELNIGYVLGNVKETKKFEFNGMAFPFAFMMSRLLWMVFGVGLIGGISFLFHRFDKKEERSQKRRNIETEKRTTMKEVLVINLPKTQVNFSVIPLLKTEFLLILRKGKKWLWFMNLMGMVLLAVLPINISHQLVLPVLWFLQVSRLSDITTKEIRNNVHYFTFSAYKPLGRLLISQITAPIILMLILAAPLIIRLLIANNLSGVLAVGLGAILLVLLAAVLGLLSRGNKLFEVLFFMLTYANINRIPFVDYFGGFQHHNSYYLGGLFILLLCAGSLIFILRTYELKK